MNNDEIVVKMRRNNFSEKQIDNLKKLSEKHSASLYDTVFELARRFPRSLFVHTFVFLIIIYQYLTDIKQDYYKPSFIFLYIGILCLVYLMLHIFAPLLQGYKARKVIKEIQRNGKS